MTHICVGKLTIIGPDNGLSPCRHQAIIWTNAGILLIGPLGTNFSENLIEIQTFHSRKCPWKMSSAKWCPFCLGLNVLMATQFLDWSCHFRQISSTSLDRYIILFFCNDKWKSLNCRLLNKLQIWWWESAVLLSHPGLGWLYVFSSFFAASTASVSAAAKTFASHVKTVSAKPYIFGTKNIWVWGNVLDDLSMTLTQGPAVASINKYLFVCTIKWQPLIVSLQNMAALLP